MASMQDIERSANTMTDAECTELIGSGWNTDVVLSLRFRGFRPCKPDYIAARFEGIDIRRTMGFIRQTAHPHLHITVARDELSHVVMERIDTAIYEAGMRIGHESLASSFMSFFERCKHWKPAPDISHLEKRLARLEAKLSNNSQPPSTTSTTVNPPPP